MIVIFIIGYPEIQYDCIIIMAGFNSSATDN